MDVLYITRKNRGIGGMQRQNRDAWQALRGLSEASRLHCIRPYTAPWGVGRALKLTVRHQMPVLLGDAALAFLAPLLKRAGAPRVFLTAHGLDLTYPNTVYQTVLRKALGSVDRVLCVSRATAAYAENLGVPRDKIRIVPCGIDPQRIALASGPRKGSALLSVGRLVPRKGIGWFLSEVFSRILQDLPDATYDIVGDGPEAPSLRLLIRERGWCSRVHIHPRADDSTVQTLLGRSALLVLPNIAVQGDLEGFGIVALEAASAGTPIAAARVEGLQDSVLEDLTGAFYHSGDAKDCVRVILALLRDPPAPSLVREAVLQRFESDIVASTLLDALV